MTQVTFTGTISFPWGLLSAPVTYPAPTLAEMIASLSRDLRDPDNQTLTEAALPDYTRLAALEAGRTYPTAAGEYAALVASGVLTLAQAAPLVRFRAAAMQEAVPVGAGAMAASISSATM